MLRIKPRSITSKFYSIRGTFKVADETIEIDWTKTDIPVSKKITSRFEETFTEKWKEDWKKNNLGGKPKKYVEAHLELMSDPHETFAKQEILNHKKVVTYLGNYKLNQITNKLIAEKALECYTSIKEYKGLQFHQQSRDKQIEISSKNATVNRNFINQVSKVLHYSANNNWCHYMRVKHLPTLTGKNRPKYPFTLDELIRCLESKADFQTKLLLVFMLYTGARLQEALDVTWNGINYYNNEPQIDLVNNKIFLWQGKQDEGRVIEIHPTLRVWLMKINYREDRLFEWTSLAYKKNTVFGLSNRWIEMLDYAGISHKKLRHAVRHTYATFLLNYAGASDTQLMDLGGWKDKNSINVYGSSIPEEVSKKINMIPNLH